MIQIRQLFILRVKFFIADPSNGHLKSPEITVLPLTCDKTNRDVKMVLMRSSRRDASTDFATWPIFTMWPWPEVKFLPRLLKVMYNCIWFDGSWCGKHWCQIHLPRFLWYAWFTSCYINSYLTKIIFQKRSILTLTWLLMFWHLTSSRNTEKCYSQELSDPFSRLNQSIIGRVRCLARRRIFCVEYSMLRSGKRRAGRQNGHFVRHSHSVRRFRVYYSFGISLF